jgi:hypothetical protein
MTALLARQSQQVGPVSTAAIFFPTLKTIP